MKSTVSILLPALVWLALAPASAPIAFARDRQNFGGQYMRQAWTTEEGLPQNFVTAVVQTRDGYLWLGTFGGLARFDGVKFTLFNSGNTPGLNGNRILSLYEDREGSLWIGTEHGGLIRYRQGQFTPFNSTEEMPSDSAGQIREDREGNLWITTDKGLVRSRDGALVTFTTKDGLPDDSVHIIHPDGRGNLWVGTHGGWLCRFRDGRFVNYRPLPDAQPNDRVLALAEAPAGGLWVGTNRGLFRFEEGAAAPWTRHEELSHDQIKGLVGDTAGGLWVATDTRGVFRLGEGVVTRYAVEHAAATDSANCLTEDREGNVWIGTDYSGLVRLSKRRVFTYPPGPESAHYNVVPITEDTEGRMWIGATCAGAVPLDPATLRAVPGKTIRLKDCVWSLHAGRDGSLWIGTWGGGLTRHKDGVLTTYTPTNSGLSNEVVLALHEDRAGGLWVGTEGGLNRFRNGRFTAYRTTDGLVHDGVRFITEDRAGALWVGTAGGMSRFQDGRFTNYTTAEGLPHNFVQAIHADPEGTLWVGTDGGGLSRFKDGRFVHYSTRHGLFDDFISRILEDDQGNLWIGSNRGIFRLSRRELDEFADGRVRAITSVWFGLSDGMPVSGCTGGGQPAGWRARDGRLWFPTTKGAVAVNPRETNTLAPPLVLIEEVIIDNAAADPHGASAAPPGEGNLEIRYTGLSLGAPEKVRFKYKLEGYDEDWVDAGTRREAFYTKIPPGAYQFRVIASNSDGGWNDAGAAYHLRLRPHFYQTNLFYAFVSLSLAGVVFLLYRLRVTKLRREHAAQQAFSTQLIASQEAERKRIAAELHDSLGQSLAIIKNRALLSLNTPDNHERTLEQMDEIATAATQAIDEVKVISYNLRPHQLDRLGLTRAITTMLDKVAAPEGLRLTARIDQIDGVFPHESEINLYRIVQESVSNIVKHAEAAAAEVVIRREARRVEVVIRDDGKGFDPEAPTENEAHHATGFGLIGIAERVRILGGTLAIRSAPGHGTTMTIRFDTEDGRNGN